MTIKYINDTDSFTKRRLNNGDHDHHLDLEIIGVRIGNTGKVRWRILHDEEYEPEYVADVLEKVIEVMRSEDSIVEVED